MDNPTAIMVDTSSGGSNSSGRSLLTERLESLGSALKSQIMSDLSAWEERRRSEAQAARNKKFTNKRARPQPLPDLPHALLVGLRDVRRILYTASDDSTADTDAFKLKQVTCWCIGVLAVFVSVADMKGNCKLCDLIGLSGAKAVFQLLVAAVEIGFSTVGVDAAELAFVARVVDTTKDPRAVSWILNQYGVSHRSSFLRCLHLYLISKTPRSAAMPATAGGSEAAGLSQAINELAAAFPIENARALGGVLQMYKQVALDHTDDLDSVDEDDFRRFVLFYLLQSPLMIQQTSIPGLSSNLTPVSSTSSPAAAATTSSPSSPSAASHRQKNQPLLFSMLFATATEDLGTRQESTSTIGDCSWLADAIIFEMRSNFSRFLVNTDETPLLKPLSQAIGVLFGDTGKAKKISDQQLDINKALDVLSLVNLVVRSSYNSKNSNVRALNAKADANEDNNDDGDVEMADSDSANGPDYCLQLVNSCRHTLVQLIAREQELVVLNQLPKTVKNMPQPVLNGLQEAMQKGGRVYNNGPINVATIGFNEADLTCKRFFVLLTDIMTTAKETEHRDNNENTSGSERSAHALYKLICETAPMLVEVLVSRVDAPAVLKSLVRCLIEGWPIRFGNPAGPDQASIYALYRSLLAISEGNRGLLHRHVLQVLNHDLVKNRRHLSMAQVQHIVDLLASAVVYERAVIERRADPLQTDPQLPWAGSVFEVVSDLTNVLLVSWRLMWNYCFGAPQDETSDTLEPIALWTLRRDLVCALSSLVTLPRALRFIDRLVLMEHALRELVKIQGAVCRVVATDTDDDGGVWSDKQKEVADVEAAAVILARELVVLVLHLAKCSGIGRAAMDRLLQVALLPATSKYPDKDDVLNTVFVTGYDDGVPTTLLHTQGEQESARKGGIKNELAVLLHGQVLSATQKTSDRLGKPDDGSNQLLDVAERLVWQNAVRPLPKYPRSGMHRHDRAGDAWTFARRQKGQHNDTIAAGRTTIPRDKPQPNGNRNGPSSSTSFADADADDGLLLVGSKWKVNARWPLIALAILSLARQPKQKSSGPSGMAVLGQLLEEYYVDSLPSMPPSLLDERLSSGRLQLHPLEIELLHDVRHNKDLEFILTEMLQDKNPQQCGDSGAVAAKQLVSALLVALIVLWNGALGEPTIKRQRDLEFTTHIVAHIVEAYHFDIDDTASQRKARSILYVFPLISGGDLARLLHVFVWRWVMHRMPSAEDDSQRLLMHILRRYIVKTAHLFKFFA
ncbi:hypothetical protein IWW48_002850 [Coemansia sp. RSA 1200]|nr:hypothetical protein IWW48_002850 [Coemansia sp. RSA 1200]